jgi:hypothetical protein
MGGPWIFYLVLTALFLFFGQPDMEPMLVVMDSYDDVILDDWCDRWWVLLILYIQH